MFGSLGWTHLLVSIPVSDISYIFSLLLGFSSCLSASIVVYLLCAFFEGAGA